MSQGLLAMNGTLFPPYLIQGSEGTAVAFLQGILQAQGFAPADMVRDGVYSDTTAEAVKKLQQSCGLKGEDLDGQFGPITRRALDEAYCIDVSLMPRNPCRDANNTFCSPEFEGVKYWDGFEAKNNN